MIPNRRLRYVRRQQIKRQAIFSLVISFFMLILLAIFLWIRNSPEVVLYSPIGIVKAQEKDLTVEDKIRAAFPEDSDMAVHVAVCESSLNPESKHTNSSASGLFQIIRGTWKDNNCGDNPFDSDQNIACARKIWQKYGWAAKASWAASMHCWRSK